jgi:hypothetical protein
MSLKSDGGMILRGENRRTRRKTCPTATLSTTNPTWIDPGAKPGLLGQTPATNDLSYGTALNPSYTRHYVYGFINILFHTAYSHSLARVYIDLRICFKPLRLRLNHTTISLSITDLHSSTNLTPVLDRDILCPPAERPHKSKLYSLAKRLIMKELVTSLMPMKRFDLQ